MIGDGKVGGMGEWIRRPTDYLDHTRHNLRAYLGVRLRSRGLRLTPDGTEVQYQPQMLTLRSTAPLDLRPRLGPPKVQTRGRCIPQIGPGGRRTSSPYFVAHLTRPSLSSSSPTHPS